MSRAAIDVSVLPDHVSHTRHLLWWGQVGMMAIESTVFALLAATYLYLRFWVAVWPPRGASVPRLLWPAVNLVILIVSAVSMRIADKAAEKRDLVWVRIGLAAGIVLGLVFLVIRTFLWKSLDFDYASHSYGSIVFAILGMHTFHVIAAIGEAAVLLVIAFLPDRFHHEQAVGVVSSGLYWNFVVVSWILFFPVIFLGPRWL